MIINCKFESFKEAGDIESKASRSYLGPFQDPCHTMLPVTGQLVSLTPLPPPMVPDVHLVNPPEQPLQPSFCYLRFFERRS